MIISAQTAVVSLVVLGAAVMGRAILKTRQMTIRLKRENVKSNASNNPRWAILPALMTFFLLGYCVAIYLVIAQQTLWLTVLTGIVFFFGALFVLFSVSVYDTTLRQLIASQDQLRAENERATQALSQLKTVQHDQMLKIHTKKMQGLAQMSAGIAHEINNPVGFIHSNLGHIQQYTADLLTIIDAYKSETQPTAALLKATEDIEFDFIRTDIFKSLGSMRTGTQRIRTIVKAMRNFSRLDESQLKAADITEDISSTLMMLQGKLDRAPTPIRVETAFDPSLSDIYCDHSAINQALLHILSNAIESFAHRPKSSQLAVPTIKIRTQQTDEQWAHILISDNGSGISREHIDHIFDPFFTTKPVGQGSGLGLSVSHQIVAVQHQGLLLCNSTPDVGTTVTMKLPIKFSAK